MTTQDPGPGSLPDRVAWSRPYVSLTAGPIAPAAGGQGGFLTDYEHHRAPLIRAAVWMFYRDQARASWTSR